MFEVVEPKSLVFGTALLSTNDLSQETSHWDDCWIKREHPSNYAGYEKELRRRAAGHATTALLGWT
jgi:hypothetical protein